eukprot:gene56164-63026_t
MRHGDGRCSSATGRRGPAPYRPIARPAAPRLRALPPNVPVAADTID